LGGGRRDGALVDVDGVEQTGCEGDAIVERLGRIVEHGVLFQVEGTDKAGRRGVISGQAEQVLAYSDCEGDRVGGKARGRIDSDPFLLLWVSGAQVDEVVQVAQLPSEVRVVGQGTDGVIVHHDATWVIGLGLGLGLGLGFG
jgi:hypothetical protein